MSGYAGILDWAIPHSQRYEPKQLCEVTPLFSAADWVPSVLDSLRHLVELPVNWDGAGARRIEPDAVAAAKNFVSALKVGVLPAPDVCPVAGGKVGLHWQFAGKELELTFQAAGEIEYLKTITALAPAGEGMDEGPLRAGDLRSALDLLLWLVIG